jgi:hypothetical protein
MTTQCLPVRQIRTLLLAILAGLPMLAAGAGKPAVPPWTPAEALGAFRVVAINKPNPRKLTVFHDALRATCKAKTHCNVLFVDVRDLKTLYGMPEREQRESALLAYTTNRGFEWNCKFRPDADNCFSWD